MTEALDVLQDFKNLKKLLVPYVVILGWSKKGTSHTTTADRLPPHISSLTLTDDLLDMEDSEWSSSDLLPQVQSILSEPKPRPQYELSLYLRHTENRWTSNERDELKESCAINRVRCRILEPSNLLYDGKPLERPYTCREDDSRRVRGGFRARGGRRGR